MILLILGVLLWSLVHLLPAIAPDWRRDVISRLGLGPYKGLFALLIILSVVLMVWGWRISTPVALYSPPAWGRFPVIALMLLVSILLVASSLPCNMKQVVRHPQLTGVTLWALAHLLANGDSRSLILFGGVGIWAVLSIWAINHRDGIWIKTGRESLAGDAIALALGVAVYAGLFFAHPWISGVGLMT